MFIVSWLILLRKHASNNIFDNLKLVSTIVYVMN